MELPIFSNNLKSSGTWAEILATDLEVWKQLSLDQREGRTRLAQVGQFALRTGGGLESSGLSGAFAQVSIWAAEGKFSLDRLLTLHRLLTGAAAEEDLLRKTAPALIGPMHDPAPAQILPKMLENAFDWFSTDSFAELHPVEAASVVYLRLLDLHPFPAHTETSALLAAGYYTERAGYPPLVIYADELTTARYANALEAAFRMLTQPLVELFAEMLRRTMRGGGADVR